MGSCVEIRGISKSYIKGKKVLEPIDLTVNPGEIFFLLGSSGCGKSTLLRTIAGLLTPDSGKIFFDGSDITDLAPEKRRAAMVFQNYALWPIMNVLENVEFGLKAMGKLSSGEIRKRAMEALDHVRLADYADRKIQSLSGGQQQRVALARALAVDPAVLLLDEPLSNLDARLRDEMRLEIRRICKERSLTSIYVTHDRREALSMADRIAVLNNGILHQTGTPRELYCTPTDKFVACFLGDANILSGKIQEGNKIETALGVLPFQSEKTFSAGTEAEVMIRPSAFSFTRQNSSDVSVKAVLTEGTYLGERTEWLLDSACGKLTVSETFPPIREFNQTCELFVAPENIVLLPGSCK